jgi:hypothetical protein
MQLMIVRGLTNARGVKHDNHRQASPPFGAGNTAGRTALRPILHSHELGDLRIAHGRHRLDASPAAIFGPATRGAALGAYGQRIVLVAMHHPHLVQT